MTQNWEEHLETVSRIDTESDESETYLDKVMYAVDTGKAQAHEQLEMYDTDDIDPEDVDEMDPEVREEFVMKASPKAEEAAQFDQAYSVIADILLANLEEPYLDTTGYAEDMQVAVEEWGQEPLERYSDMEDRDDIMVEIIEEELPDPTEL